MNDAAAYVIPMVTNEKQNNTANIKAKYMIPAKTKSIIAYSSFLVARPELRAICFPDTACHDQKYYNTLLILYLIM